MSCLKSAQSDWWRHSTSKLSLHPYMDTHACVQAPYQHANKHTLYILTKHIEAKHCFLYFPMYVWWELLTMHFYFVNTCELTSHWQISLFNEIFQWVEALGTAGLIRTSNLGPHGVVEEKGLWSCFDLSTWILWHAQDCTQTTNKRKGK